MKGCEICLAFCINCGYELPEGATFCEQCGTRAAANSVRSARESVSSPETISPATRPLPPALEEGAVASGRLLMCFFHWLRHRRVPFLSAIIAGLLAHGFAFTNKLLNADEVSTLFGKGATIESGRWALALSSYLFPDISMPWIYGLLSIFFIAVAACLAIELFTDSSSTFSEPSALEAALAAVLTTFPAVTCLFCYMFTSASYALAYLMSVLAVYLVCRRVKHGLLWSGILMLVSLGVYQANLTVAASLFVVYMIRCLLQEETSATEVLKFGLQALGMLIAALIVYAAVTLVTLRVTGTELLGYGISSEYGLLHRFLMNYSSFIRTVTRGFFGYIPTKLDSFVHILCAVITVLLLLRWAIRTKDNRKRLLMLVCLAIFPLSIFCFYLVADIGILHSLVFYGYVSVYFLAASVFEGVKSKYENLCRDLLSFSLITIILCNIYTANKTYLRTYLQYENAFSFYTGVITQVKQTEGFDPSSKLALIGTADNNIYTPSELDTGSLAGPSADLENIYTRDLFIRHYIGFDANFASSEEKRELSKDERFIAMPEYPYYGSVQEIDGYIVVKLG